MFLASAEIESKINWITLVASTQDEDSCNNNCLHVTPLRRSSGLPLLLGRMLELSVVIKLRIWCLSWQKHPIWPQCHLLMLKTLVYHGEYNLILKYIYLTSSTYQPVFCPHTVLVWWEEGFISSLFNKTFSAVCHHPAKGEELLLERFCLSV